MASHTHNTQVEPKDDIAIHQTPSHVEHSKHHADLAHPHENVHEQSNNLGGANFSVDADAVSRAYWRSPRLIGTIFAVGMNLLASTGGFAMISPIFLQINAAIGPGPIIWLSLVYTIGLAIGLTLVGQMSDIFGRRWFFICGTLLGAIGAAISGRANSINMCIAGQTLIGLSASTGYSYAAVSGELVPTRWRFLVNAIIFWFSLPTAGFGSAISTAFVLNTAEGWRWSYYLLIIANGLTALLYFIFYHPPTFRQKHGRDTILHWVKNYDYIGMFLYIAGLLLFILGLSWGGSVYPWASAAVIAPVIIGFFCLVSLFVYEAKFKPAEPLVPIHLFKNRGFTAYAIILSLAASVYYSQAIVWPQMAATVYAEGNVAWAGIAGCLVGIGITIGEIIGGKVAVYIGHMRFQCIAMLITGTVFLGAMATCTPDTPGRAMAFVFIATTAIGWNEAIALPACTICIPDQREIGTAAGIAGSTRSAISTVASTVYSVVLTASTTKALGTTVPERLAGAGLSASSIADFMTASAAGATPSVLSGISGVTDSVLAVGARAYRDAYADAYRMIFYTSIGFGVLSLIAALFCPDFEERITNEVAAQLNVDGEQPVRDEKKVVV